MTRSEAGRLGVEKSKPIQEKLKQERIEKYNENPNVCLNCGKSLPYEKRQNKFCNHSCNAIYNNSKRRKKINYCKNCGKELKSTQQTFCCNDCQKEQYYKEYIEKWKSGIENGLKGEYGISNYIRRYLTLKYNNSCQLCGWNKENLFTHKVPLEVHHIDGDYTNNSEENLQLLCPNCHSLTETYKAANKNGRKERKKYYINITDS